MLMEELKYFYLQEKRMISMWSDSRWEDWNMEAGMTNEDD